MPIPPAININRLILFSSMSGGGQAKLPPTLTSNGLDSISDSACQNHAAGGFLGAF